MKGRENDVRIETEKVILKTRACGLTINNEKYLFVNMGSPYWCLPGGHLELNEDSKSGVEREMREETGMKVRAENLFLFNENFFFNSHFKKHYHELAFYYVVTPANKADMIEDQIRIENDKGVMKRLEFKWFSKAELENVEIRPNIIKELILSDKIYDINHVIYKE